MRIHADPDPHSPPGNFECTRKPADLGSDGELAKCLNLAAHSRLPASLTRTCFCQNSEVREQYSRYRYQQVEGLAHHAADAASRIHNPNILHLGTCHVVVVCYGTPNTKPTSLPITLKSRVNKNKLNFLKVAPPTKFVPQYLKAKIEEILKKISFFLSPSQYRFAHFWKIKKYQVGTILNKFLF